MAFVSKCLLLILFSISQLGFAIRAHVQDSMGEDIDDLKVLYKYCFAYALKQATLAEDRATYPVIQNDDGDTDHSISIYNTYMALRANESHCSFHMTRDPFRQREVEVSDVFKSDRAVLAYRGYKRRPEKSWFDLSVDADDKALVEHALKQLYISGMRYKNQFYINDWHITVKCGSRASGEWVVKQCMEVLASRDGQFKFIAAQGLPNDAPVHVNNDGALTLEVSKLGTAFEASCQRTLVELDHRFRGISSELCAGTKSLEWSGNVIKNVGWTNGDDKFYWKM